MTQHLVFGSRLRCRLHGRKRWAVAFPESQLKQHRYVIVQYALSIS